MTTAFELGPDDQLPDGALVIPGPWSDRLTEGQAVTVVQGRRIRRARIRATRPHYAIADPDGAA